MITFDQIPETLIESVALTAQIDTALCVGAGGSSGSLADKPIVRRANGKLLIPGSQLKGRWRHECEKLAKGLGWPVCDSPRAENMCPQRAYLHSDPNHSNHQTFHRADYQQEDERGHCLICQIFGNPSLASRIEVDDLVCPENGLPEVIRPGVTINRRRQTAEDSKLYFLETSPPAIALQFKGHVHLYPGLPPSAKLLLRAALLHIHALGGSKSAGLGWLTWQSSDFGDLSGSDWTALLPGATS
jgi:CRISPR/Cas system CSM-associated protein Csm3 (group 7 of RAMP superfamily)